MFKESTEGKPVDGVKPDVATVDTSTDEIKDEGVEQKPVDATVDTSKGEGEDGKKEEKPVETKEGTKKSGGKKDAKPGKGTAKDDNTTTKGNKTTKDDTSKDAGKEAEKPTETPTETPAEKPAEQPKQPAQEVKPVKPQFTPETQTRFDKDSYDNERSRTENLSVEQLEALRIELDPLRGDQEKQDAFNKHVDSVADQAEKDRINGRLLAVDNVLAEKYMQRAQGGEPLTPDQMNHVLKNFVNNGRSSALEQVYVNRLGFKTWQDALGHFNNGKGFTLDDGNGGKLFDVDKQQKEGVLAKMLDKCPNFLKRSLTEVARGGAVSMATWGAISLLGGAVAWPAVLVGAGAGAGAAIIGHAMRDKALYGKRANGKSRGEDAMRSAVEYMLQSKEQARGALANENLSPEERARIFNQIVGSLRENSINKLDRSGLSDGRSLSAVEKFEKTRKKADLMIGAARIGANLLGGGLMSWHEALARVAEAKAHGVLMASDHVVSNLPNNPVPTNIGGHAYALGHKIVYGADHAWHAVLDQRDILAAHSNLMGSTPGFSPTMLTHFWHHLNPDGAHHALNSDVMREIVSGNSQILHAGLVTDPTTEIFRNALTNGFQNTALVGGFNGLISLLSSNFGKNRAMRKQAESAEDQLRRTLQYVPPTSGAAGTGGPPVPPNNIPPAGSPEAAAAEAEKRKEAEAKGEELPSVTEKAKKLDESLKEFEKSLPDNSAENPESLYGEKFKKMRRAIMRRWEEPENPENRVYFVDANDAVRLKGKLKDLINSKTAQIFVTMKPETDRKGELRQQFMEEAGFSPTDRNVLFLPNVSIKKNEDGTRTKIPIDWKDAAQKLIDLKKEKYPETKLELATLKPGEEDGHVPDKTVKEEGDLSDTEHDDIRAKIIERTLAEMEEAKKNAGDGSVDDSVADEHSEPVVEDNADSTERRKDFAAVADEILEKERISTESGIATRLQEHLFYDWSPTKTYDASRIIYKGPAEGVYHSADINVKDPEIILDGLDGEGLLKILFSPKELATGQKPSSLEVYTRAEFLKKYLANRVERYKKGNREADMVEAAKRIKAEMHAARQNKELSNNKRRALVNELNAQLIALEGFDAGSLVHRAVILTPCYVKLHDYVSGRLEEYKGQVKDFVEEQSDSVFYPELLRVQPFSTDFELHVFDGLEPQERMSRLLAHYPAVVARYATYLRELSQSQDENPPVLPEGLEDGAQLIESFSALRSESSSARDVLSALDIYRATRSAVVDNMQGSSEARDALDELDALNNYFVDLAVEEAAVVTPKGSGEAEKVEEPVEEKKPVEQKPAAVLSGEDLTQWLERLAVLSRTPERSLQKITTAATDQDLAKLLFSEEEVASGTISTTEVRDRLKQYMIHLERDLNPRNEAILEALDVQRKRMVSESGEVETPDVNRALLRGEVLNGWIERIMNDAQKDLASVGGVTTMDELIAKLFNPIEISGGKITEDQVRRRMVAIEEYIAKKPEENNLAEIDIQMAVRELRERLEVTPFGSEAKSRVVIEGDVVNETGTFKDLRHDSTLRRELALKFDNTTELPEHLRGESVNYAELRAFVSLPDDNPERAVINRESILRRLKFMIERAQERAQIESASELTKQFPVRLQELSDALERASLAEVAPQSTDVHGKL